MKTFLLKVLLFFGSASVFLFITYAVLDPDDSTLGDVRYTKTRNIQKGIRTEEYDALIIGSSRVHDIGNLKSCNHNLYNFGIIQGMPEDFVDFITFARQEEPFRKVIVGFDFEGGSRYGLNDSRMSWRSSKDYIRQVSDETELDRLLSIFDFPRFKRLVNYKVLQNNPFERDQAMRVKTKEWNFVFKDIYEKAYSTYAYNDSIQDVLKEIRTASAGSELIVYLTPVSRPLFDLLIQHELTKEYERLLRDLVASYGTVINYMEVNAFTSDPLNFKDENHLTNENLEKIVCGLLNADLNRDIPCTVLNADNIEAYIAQKRYLKQK